MGTDLLLGGVLRPDNIEGQIRMDIGLLEGVLHPGNIIYKVISGWVLTCCSVHSWRL